jgi:hypothetical protein
MQLHEKYKEKASMFRAKALALGFVGKCSGVSEQVSFGGVS